MNSMENAIGSMNIENRYDIVMQKIALSQRRERITVPEALNRNSKKVADVGKSPTPSHDLKK